jgi:hypothetical protein
MVPVVVDGSRHTAPIRGEGVVVARWFDAFADPFLVSKVIARERVEQFARSTGSRLVSKRGG